MRKRTIIICRDCGTQVEVRTRKLRCADCNHVHQKQWLAARRAANRERISESKRKRADEQRKWKAAYDALRELGITID
jgi:hypothetical protein